MILHNISETSMTVHPRVQMGGASHFLAAITLGADQVTKLDLRRALHGLRPQGSVAGGIELTYEGEPDALRAHGLLFDGEGFSTQVDFSRVGSLSEPEDLTYHAPRFAIGVADPILGLGRNTKFDPFIVFHNFNQERLHGRISVSFYDKVGPQEIQIPLELQAGETRVMDLESYLAGHVPSDVHWAGMEVRYNAKRSALAMTMVSLSEDRKHSIRSVLNWVQTTTREGWYWRVDRDTNTIVGIQNSASEEANVVFSIDYYVGEARHSYELPLKIPARSSHLVDMGEIRRSGQPDQDGDVIPRSVTFGGYRAIKQRSREEGPLTTEALIVDSRRRSFLTVYNTGCCELAFFDPPSMSGTVGGAGPIIVMLQNECSGDIYDSSMDAWYTNYNSAVVVHPSKTGHLN